jgi:hypothetical protein
MTLARISEKIIVNLVQEVASEIEISLNMCAESVLEEL